VVQCVVVRFGRAGVLDYAAPWEREREKERESFSGGEWEGGS
jgi:hypothetical protein